MYAESPPSSYANAWDLDLDSAIYAFRQEPYTGIVKFDAERGRVEGQWNCMELHSQKKGQMRLEYI